MSTFTGREADAGELAAATIRRESGQQLVSFLHADHATVAGNRQLAGQVKALFPRPERAVQPCPGPPGCRRSGDGQPCASGPVVDTHDPVDDSQTMPTLRLVWPLLRVVQRCRSPGKAGQ
jgi:hypothetical protein